MKNFCIIIILFFLSSCASILNKKGTHINILTNTPAKLVIGKDTLITKDLKRGRYKILLSLPRQKDSLQFSMFNDVRSRNITIHAGNSFAYWLNIYATWGIGMVVDRHKPKRYTYPRKIVVAMNESPADTSVYLPESSHISNYKNNFKITPLRLLFSHPGIELSYERYLGKRFSVQVGIAHLYEINFNEPEGKGTQFSAEVKYFDISRVKTFSLYTSLESGFFNVFIANYAINHKSIYYFIPKLGLQSRLGERFLLDAYAGLGLKYQENSFSPSANAANRTDYGTIFWDMRVSLNAKIGFLF